MDGGREAERPTMWLIPHREARGQALMCTIWSGFMMWMIANEMILIMLLGVPNED
jgi:hypothetical protein